MKLQLNLLLTVYAWIIGLAAWLPVGATAQPIRLLQTTPPSQAEQQTVRFGAYEIIMTAQPQQPGQVEVSVKDSQSGQEAFRLSVSDVYSRHYHAAEFHQGHLYIIRRVGDKAAWNDELWRYGTSGPGTKLYSGRGLDFRVAPDESLIAATTDFNLTFIDAEGEAVQEFTVEGLTHRRDEFYAEVDLLSWSDDSAVFWGQLVTVGKPQTIYRIKAGDWRPMIRDVSALPLFWEAELNPNTGYLAYSNYPNIFTEEDQRLLEETQRPVTLYVRDLIWQQYHVIDKSNARLFQPEWIDDTTLTYNDPESENRLTYSLEIPLAESLIYDSLPAFESELAAQGYVSYTQTISQAEAIYQATIYRLSDPLESFNLPNYLVISKESGGQTSLLYTLRDDYHLDFLKAGGQELPQPGWSDINGDGLLELPYFLWKGTDCPSCTQLIVLQLRPEDQVINLVQAVPPEEGLGRAFILQNLRDMNGDGVVEWQVADNRWDLYFRLCILCTPVGTRFYAWDGQTYRNVSAQFAAAYEPALTQARLDLEQMVQSDRPWDGSEFAQLISMLLAYENAGRGAEGWAIFEQYADPAQYPDRLTAEQHRLLLTVRELFRTWHEADPAPVTDYKLGLSEPGIYRSESNFLHVTGVITNQDEQPLTVGLVGGLYNADGEVLDADYTNLPLTVLAPGESVPYQLDAFRTIGNNQVLAQQVAGARVRVAYAFPAEVQAVPLDIQPLTQRRADSAWVFEGEVTNTSGQTLAGQVRISLALYDAQGHLVATGSTYVFGETSPQVAPLEVIPYGVSIILPPDTNPAELRAEGYAQGYIKAN